MDLRPSVRTQRARRILRPLETVGPMGLAHDSPTLWHQTQERRRCQAAVCRHRTAHAVSRQHHQLRRCRPGRRTYSAMGHAESRSKVPSPTPVDIIPNRRVHTRGVQHPQGSDRIPAPIRGWPLPRYRRLDPWHECHPSIYAQIRTEKTGALHRTSADPHISPYRQATARDRKLRPQTQLGTLYYV